MSIARYRGVATAQSSIAHGAQALGTITYLRRERFLLPNNQQEDIPVISGNAWRGILRDTASDLWLEKVGSPKMPLAVVHALWSGGALAKVAGPTLTGSRLASLRKAVPVIGLFGAAGGGRIIDGCLQVGKMIPICQETKHIVPEEFHYENLPSLWDVTQIESYSRNSLIPKSALLQDESSGDSFDPMRFGVETFIAGTKFYTWINLSHPTQDEHNFFLETMESYLLAPRVGGLAGTGHGSLTFDFPKLHQEIKELVNWQIHDNDKEALGSMLAWLN